MRARPSPTSAGEADADDPARRSNLTTAFDTARGEITAIEDVSFTLDAGEILGIVGESGSGKSVTALTIMGLLPQPPARIAAGTIRFAGQDLTKLSDPACSASAAPASPWCSRSR